NRLTYIDVFDRAAVPSFLAIYSRPEGLEGPKAVKMNIRVVQPWPRVFPPLKSGLDTCWSPSGKARTLRFTAAGNTATHCRSWHWHSPQNSRRLRVSGGSSTNTRSQANSIPRGQPGLWPSLVTKGAQSLYSGTL